ncbi:MAG: hypothetical protein ACP5QR_05745 [Rhizomicrobium sp.]
MTRLDPTMCPVKAPQRPSSAGTNTSGGVTDHASAAKGEQGLAQNAENGKGDASDPKTLHEDRIANS